MGKRVAFISSDAKTFGLFRKDLTETILKKGYEVHIIVPFKTQEQYRYLESLVQTGAKLHHIDCTNSTINPIGDALLFCQLLLILRKIQPDISFCYFIKPVIYGILASRFTGVAHICALISGLGYVFTSRSLKARLICFFVTYLYKLSLKYSDKIIFQNSDNMHFMAKRVKGIKPKCFVVDGSGVNMQIYKRIGEVNHQKASFVFAGRLLESKGVKEYMRAVDILKQTHGDRFNATLIGSGYKAPGVLEMIDIKRLNRQASIEILEDLGQKELVETYQKCNVFVLPSHYGEGIPRSILEAMSMKMAIITTDWPGCRETVAEGKNGMLVGIKSVEELVRVMGRLIVNPEIIPVWGARSFQIARERFEVSRINQHYLKHMEIN